MNRNSATPMTIENIPGIILNVIWTITLDEDIDGIHYLYLWRQTSHLST